MATRIAPFPGQPPVPHDEADDANYDTVSGQRATLFQGETLRGLLLNAYAFGKMGTIAGIAAISAFIAAGVMLLLAGLGFLHTGADRLGVPTK